MEPGDQGIDVVDRQPDGGAERMRVGRHVGAFEQDGAEIGMPRDEASPGLDHVLGGEADVQILLLGPDQDAEELAPVLRAFDRRAGRNACRLEMGGGERRGGDRNDAEPFARAAASP